MEREKKIIKTSILGIIMNVVLVAFKGVVGLISNSIAIILDAVNNLTDVISSVVTIIGTKLANRKPDKKHPYGHGRIEYIAATIISMIILIAGIIALKESIDKIFNPEDADYSIISLIIIAVAVLVKYIFSKYAKKVGKSINSQVLVATGEDAFMDSILSFSTLVCAIINFIWKLRIEGYIGVLIAIFIIKTAIEILRDTVNSMIGERADKELTDAIKEKINSYDEVQGAFDLTLHNYGPSNTIGTVHIQVRDDMTAQEIHILTRNISYDVFNEFGILMSIGIYASNDKGEFGEIKNDVIEEIGKYEHIKQIHGFYVDKSTNTVYFDLIIDFECKNPEEIKDKLVSTLKEKYNEYNFSIIIDADISE